MAAAAAELNWGSLLEDWTKEKTNTQLPWWPATGLTQPWDRCRKKKKKGSCRRWQSINTTKIDDKKSPPLSLSGGKKKSVEI
jgi:hypothetical protein